MSSKSGLFIAVELFTCLEKKGIIFGFKDWQFYVTLTVFAAKCLWEDP